MTPNDFIYWIQGFFELSGNVECLTKDQVEMIKKHIALVSIQKVNQLNVPVLPNYNYPRPIEWESIPKVIC